MKLSERMKPYIIQGGIVQQWIDKADQLEIENEDLRLMLYGQTGWTGEEIDERLALLTAEEQDDE